MKTSILKGLAAAAVLGAMLIAVRVAWHHRRMAQAVAAELAATEADRMAFEAKVRESRTGLAAAEAARESQRTALEGLKASAIPAAKVAPSPARVERGPTIAERLQTEPDTQLYWLASKRSEAATKYRAFFRKAGLSAEQIEKFHDALIKREEQVMDISAIIQAQGLAKPDAATAKLLAKADSDLKAAQRELLGDAGFHQLAEYERTSWLRELVNGVAGGAVVVAREPLTSRQAEQLLQVMANASASYRRGGTASSGDIDWDGVDAEARTFLSPAQFKLFTTMEPPLPYGARFQSQLYRTVERARKPESPENAARPPGG